MTYELAFLEPALKEWRKLDSHTRELFKKKLAERLADSTCRPQYFPAARTATRSN